MSLAPDPAGAFVVAGGRSGSVTVLRRDTGATTEVARHATSVLAVAWDPQRGTIASADLSGVLRISRADGSGTILERTAHTFGVRALRYLPDGSRLVSGGTDDTLRLFDPDDLEETLSLRSGWPAAAISVTPDSRTISAVGALAVNGPWVRVWRSR